ncbi:MAG TPA: N-methyl-L-tryptophan oxidase [Bryobacteraceae bacterium]|nr:N-methyl-L-tryptophan oxidase [Bryobacteraceae bacterium]
MAEFYDAIVLGLGAMGSASLYHLARRGYKVLGLERFSIPHEMGSSHGVTRIIRLAYYEHPSYVPLLFRAYELWRELETRSGERLLHITGSIDAGPRDGEIFRGAQLACELHELPHEILTARQLQQRFPAYCLPADTMALFQTQGGFLLPERCIASHVKCAEDCGAEAHAHERVLGWEPRGSGVRVTTENAVYDAARLVISTGPWISELVPILKNIAVPERQVLAWFQPWSADLFDPHCFPVFNLTVEEGRYYGFPQFGIPGFKVGRYHHRQEAIDPDGMDRRCHTEDEQVLREFAEKYFPAGSGTTLSMQTCIFTNTPDEHFVLGTDPRFPHVVICSPCSGHGFKFSAVVGEIVADLCESGETRHDISLHNVNRFFNS